MIKLTNELIIEIEGYGNIVVHKDTTLYDLIKRLNKIDDIIACSINNEIVELSYKLKEDTKLKLISIKDRMGAKIYRSGLKFIYITAIKELFGINTDVKLLHSLDFRQLLISLYRHYKYLDKLNNQDCHLISDTWHNI